MLTVVLGRLEVILASPCSILFADDIVIYSESRWTIQRVTWKEGIKVSSSSKAKSAFVGFQVLSTVLSNGESKQVGVGGEKCQL